MKARKTEENGVEYIDIEFGGDQDSFIKYLAERHRVARKDFIKHFLLPFLFGLFVASAFYIPFVILPFFENHQ